VIGEIGRKKQKLGLLVSFSGGRLPTAFAWLVTYVE
jgi:hypothetical protein